MVDLKLFQKRVYDNKVKKGFNVTDVPLEFCFLHEEVSEAFHAYRKHLPDLGEELADVGLFLMGLAEVLGIDLEKEMIKKVEKNERREYQKNAQGVFERVKEG